MPNPDHKFWKVLRENKASREQLVLQAPLGQQGQRGQLGLRVQLERLVLKAMPAPLVHRDLKAKEATLDPKDLLDLLD